jgi:hypothetical protein
LALAGRLLFGSRMFPTLLACNGPQTGGGGGPILTLVILGFLLVAAAPVILSLVLGYVLSIVGYRRRNVGLALGGATLAGLNLALCRAVTVPLHLVAIMGCLAIAAAAVGRSFVLTA